MTFRIVVRQKVDCVEYTGQPLVLLETKYQPMYLYYSCHRSYSTRIHTYLPPTLSGSPGTSSSSPHFGNTIIIAVSNGTQPGSLHETCITMTVVPISRASSGMVCSIRSTIRRLCCRSIKFSFAENMVYCNTVCGRQFRGISGLRLLNTTANSMDWSTNKFKMELFEHCDKIY